MSKTYFEQMRGLMENAENWMLFIPDLFDRADKQIERLETENKKLRELVQCLVRATHPLDRADVITNAAEFLAELEVEA